MSDEVIVCVDCRGEFPFTESEASFFASKGLTKPRRCKPCRQKRKASSSASAPAAAPAEPQWIGGAPADPPARRDKKRKDRRRDFYDDP